MKAKKTILIGLVLTISLTRFFFYGKNYNIRSIDDLGPFIEEVELLDKDSLVIFDIDKVLLMESDPWERGFRWERRNSRTIYSIYRDGSALFRELELPLRDYLWSIHTQDCLKREILVDNRVIEVIKKIQDKSIKVIALTRFLVGMVGNIPAIEQWRIDDLLSHGIDFSSSFSNLDPIVFNQFFFGNRSPKFEKGILFTSHATSKGQLLKAFFDKIGWLPKNVIMIDDGKANLESVYTELRKCGIKFTGFEYRAYDKFPAYFDKDIAEFQMNYLIEHEKWLPASKAAQLLDDTFSHKN